jgi:hypothetical protein
MPSDTAVLFDIVNQCDNGTARGNPVRRFAGGNAARRDNT